MPRPTCSRIVLISLLSWWMLGGGPSRTSRADEPPDPPFLAKLRALLKDKSVQPADSDDEEKKLLKARHAAVVTMVEVALERYRAGANTPPGGSLHEVVEKWRDARLELSDKPKDQIAVLEVWFELTKDEEAHTEALYKLKRVGPDTVAAARYARLTAELQLLRAKRKLNKVK
jgi:hypothetical protein